jgi:hypothetical protein
MPIFVSLNEYVFNTLAIIKIFVDKFAFIVDADIMDSPVMEEKKEAVTLPKDFEDYLKNYIIFSVIWGVGAVIDENSRPKFSEFLFKTLNGEDVKSEFSLINLPEDWAPVKIVHSMIKEENCFDYVYNARKDEFIWMEWTKL